MKKSMVKSGKKNVIKKACLIALILSFSMCKNENEKQYYSTGEVEQECEKTSENKYTCTQFYKTGEISAKNEIVNGIPEGYYTGYTKTGNVEFRTSNREGKVNGKYISYFPNSGKIKMIINSIAGEKEGFYCTFYETGAVMYHGNYVHSMKEGKEYTFYSNQILKEIKTFEKDTLKYSQCFDSTGVFYEIRKHKF
ncbi:MAG: hypothetical protein H7331_10395 [Bacteroidia bacterium]|nr:hypothetical protein [Bacteroidia bacterium]